MAELSEAAKEARRKYYREYYQKHKEADKAKSARFWERKGEELQARIDKSPHFPHFPRFENKLYM